MDVVGGLVWKWEECRLYTWKDRCTRLNAVSCFLKLSFTGKRRVCVYIGRILTLAPKRCGNQSVWDRIVDGGKGDRLEVIRIDHEEVTKQAIEKQ